MKAKTKSKTKKKNQPEIGIATDFRVGDPKEILQTMRRMIRLRKNSKRKPK